MCKPLVQQKALWKLWQQVQERECMRIWDVQLCLKLKMRNQLQTNQDQLVVQQASYTRILMCFIILIAIDEFVNVCD